MSGDLVLSKINKANALLAGAKTLMEVTHVIALAGAAQVYAKHVQASTETQNEAAAIRLRAERRLGEMLQETPKAAGARGRKGGGTRGSKKVPQVNGQPTMAEVGISKKLSSRAQKLAIVPAAQFEAALRVAAGKELIHGKVVKLFCQAAQRQPSAEPDRDDTPGRKVKTLAELGGEKFGTIYADPPWQYGNQSTRAATDNHYSTMSVDDLCAMPVAGLAADDAHLHLWTTTSFLQDSFRVLEAWGFEYRSCFIWCKPQFGIGNYWRVSHEILLLGIRGNAKRFRVKDLRSWIEIDRGEHSAKPEIVRGFIERASPGPYLELFGRKKVIGWTVFGNQFSNQTVAFG